MVNLLPIYIYIYIYIYVSLGEINILAVRR